MRSREAGGRPMRVPGRVWLVGAGPGDPDLITVAGLKRLRAADVVVHDRLGAPALLGECRTDALRIDVGKQAGRHPVSQGDINALLVRHAAAGREVVRLKGGDPFIFGRGGEEMIALRQAGIPVEVVPGITAASACAAATGIALTHRGLASEVSLVAAHQRAGAAGCDWASLAARRDRTLVFYMGLSQAADIAQGLLRHGRPGGTPVVLVSDGATPRQRALRCTLDCLARTARYGGLASPCLILVGEVGAMADPRAVVLAEAGEEVAKWAA